MAHIFYGNSRCFDETPDVIQAASELDDRYWFLFEFNVPGANIDLLMVRPGDAGFGYSSFVMTEVKHFKGVITGGHHGQWTIERNGSVEPITPSNEKDMNPWDQTVRACDLLNRHLQESQGKFRDASAPKVRFAAWPHLLLIRKDGPGVHNLPDQPVSFGTFSFSLNVWSRRIANWQSKRGFQISEEELEAMTLHLDLTRWDPEKVSIAEMAAARERVLESPSPMVPGATMIADPRFEEMYALVSVMSERMKALEESLKPQPTPTESFSWKRFLSGRG